MPSSRAAKELDQEDMSLSPFRTAFDLARVQARAASGPVPPSAQPDERTVGSPFEYRFVKRSGKRSADEADWNVLGRQGWELVGVTRKHAAFKRPLPPELSS